jgi:hypothetical protein
MSKQNGNPIAGGSGNGAEIDPHLGLDDGQPKATNEAPKVQRRRHAELIKTAWQKSVGSHHRNRPALNRCQERT